MFTGIIQHLGTVESFIGGRLIVTLTSLASLTSFAGEIFVGSSIAINGVCLTVVEFLSDVVMFDVMEETKRCTTFGSHQIKQGDLVHVEFPCHLNAYLHGHIIQGHVHTTAKIVNISADRCFTFQLCENGDRIKYKDSIAVDGVSLTISRVDQDGCFSVNIIPHTYENTLFRQYKVGDVVNIEKNVGEIYEKIHAGMYVGHLQPEEMMEKCAEYSYDVRYAPYPNPYVACVIVCDDTIVSMGRCEGDGQPHAESLAILGWEKKWTETDRELFTTSHDSSTQFTSKFPQKSREGCVKIYVTLEPCVPFDGKRTKSCAMSIIDLAKHVNIDTIFIGMLDPDTRVQGKGVECLQSHGIHCVVMNHPKVSDILRHYIHHRTTNSTYIIGKLALTLDHCYCLENKKYISSSKALKDVHNTRRRVQTILTTEKTLAADKPKLTCRFFDDEEKALHVQVVSRDGDYGDSGVCALTELGPTALLGILGEGKINELHLYIDAQVSGMHEHHIDVAGLVARFSLQSITVFDTTVKYVYVK